jgi:hypothetical protein
MASCPSRRPARSGAPPRPALHGPAAGDADRRAEGCRRVGVLPRRSRVPDAGIRPGRLTQRRGVGGVVSQRPFVNTGAYSSTSRRTCSACSISPSNSPDPTPMKSIRRWPGPGSPRRSAFPISGVTLLAGPAPLPGHAAKPPTMARSSRPSRAATFGLRRHRQPLCLADGPGEDGLPGQEPGLGQGGGTG